MIARIKGKLVSIESDSGLVEVGNVCYEVMLPGYAISKLSGKIGSDITLCTMEYLEGTPGKGNLTPRMVGFLTPSEREFFKRYTSVKGLGIKKGLKSLTIPIETIAAAIENGDEKMLISLPAIGKRLSQVIIAELKGKLEDFAAAAISMTGQPISGAGFDIYQTEAMEILVAWGEKRNEAMELIDLASKKHPDIKTAEELVPLVYRIKQGIEV
jgi:Holliday junction DNA helicase RuvA